MSNQLRRSSQSISANIAEGFGRYYYQEGVRFCYIARGSLEESYNYLVLANELEYIPDNLLDDFKTEVAELHRMLNGYISFLKKRKRGENEPGSSHFLREDSASFETDLKFDPPDS